jgi:hypothetical protein
LASKPELAVSLSPLAVPSSRVVLVEVSLNAAVAHIKALCGSKALKDRHFALLVRCQRQGISSNGEQESAAAAPAPCRLAALHCAKTPAFQQPDGST